jgi:acid stress-induced BolA-like protein IbaG/YrbA
VDKDLIKEIISSAIPNSICFFEGVSCNLKLMVISSSFNGISLIEQHKMVLNPLKEHFESGTLHALSIETKTS